MKYETHRGSGSGLQPISSELHFYNLASKPTQKQTSCTEPHSTNTFTPRPCSSSSSSPPPPAPPPPALGVQAQRAELVLLRACVCCSVVNSERAVIDRPAPPTYCMRSINVSQRLICVVRNAHVSISFSLLNVNIITSYVGV